ncbi:Recombination protein RecR [Candidatus Xiphinematobacter sp. Idaho Grape]|uniref:recombination mediator RecR n=1 Tax=Candidatus Xiphinematobacter sp. Idaho Grape TaxID=1704307 RepID=UPI0007062E46|nr:recombination mediator RecR [Candidatus Xiphinematobacter sp. Idaho Grape]ALJ56566.1 Recombination protein RecR [Candidatus Xiphinematobacter sp. Idaho Grape]
MSKVYYPAPYLLLTDELQRLPGIGPRSAERIALWLLQSRGANPTRLANAIQEASQCLRTCKLCGFFTTEDLCRICSAPERRVHPICVVETAIDIIAIERASVFLGRYHALGGKFSPLNGIGPEQLRVTSLLARVKSERPQEIIFALSADVEGEATTHYLARLFSEQGVLVSRIAHGLPVGGGLEYADAGTLSCAISGRSRISLE